MSSVWEFKVVLKNCTYVGFLFWVVLISLPLYDGNEWSNFVVLNFELWLWLMCPCEHVYSIMWLFFLMQLGMDGFFMFRIHYADCLKRLSDKTTEMIWRGSKSLGEPAEIFTGVFCGGYGPPSGFCFDINCKTAVPIQVIHIDQHTTCTIIVRRSVKHYLAQALHGH